MSSTSFSSSPVVPRKNLIPFVLLISCFVLWGLLNNMTDNLVPAFAKIFMINAVDSSKVQIAFYGAYAVLAIPAAIIIKKYSYRAGVLVGLGLYVMGALGYIPAALLQSYELFLVSIFVLACGVSALETACNPFIIALGPEETSVRRLNLAQAFNPLGSLSGIFLAKYLILVNLNEADLSARQGMDPDALKAIRDTELFWVCTPYVGLVLIAFIIWGFFFFNKSLSETRDEGEGLHLLDSFKKLCSLPRYYYGVITQFFYVGLQITVWTWTIKYVMAIFPSYNEAQAANYYLYSILLFILCRWVCTALMRKFTPGGMMVVFAIGGIVCCLGTIYLPADISVWALIGISGCMSLMFPTIYGIALRGLGDSVKLGAAGLVMAILGGAAITFVMGFYMDSQMVNKQVSYFYSINRPEIALAEKADHRVSISSQMLALYKLSENKSTDTEKKYQEYLKVFKKLSTLTDTEQLKTAIALLPGCAKLTEEQVAFLQANLKLLPVPTTSQELQKQFEMLPVLVNQEGGCTALITSLEKKPLDINAFGKEQVKINEAVVRSSFYIPVFCFLVVLLYALFFCNVHKRKEESESVTAL